MANVGGNVYYYRSCINILSTKDQSSLALCRWCFLVFIGFQRITIVSTERYYGSCVQNFKKRDMERACKSKQHHKVIPHDVIDTIQNRGRTQISLEQQHTFLNLKTPPQYVSILWQSVTCQLTKTVLVIVQNIVKWYIF